MPAVTTYTSQYLQVTLDGAPAGLSNRSRAGAVRWGAWLAPPNPGEFRG